MAWLLGRYLDFWAWMLWPARAVTRGILGAMDQIDIWLIGDFIKGFLVIVGLMALSIYVLVFSLVPPVSYFLLATAVSAVILRTFSRRWAETKPIISAWFGSLTTLSGWSSIGFLILTTVYAWLNYLAPAQIGAAQFAGYEATIVDATALLRRYVTPTTALIVVGVMAGVTLLTASFKPIFAAATFNRSAMAVLTVFCVLGSYTAVVAQDTSSRHTRIMGEIMPRLRDNLDTTVQARQETAALRWITAEMSFRAPSDRASLLRTLGALYQSAQRICADEQAQFHAAYAVARSQHYEYTYEEVEEDSTAAANEYCSATNVSAEAISSLVRVADVSALEGSGRDLWLEDVLAETSPEMRRMANTGAASATTSIREAQALDAHVAAAADDAVHARRIVRNALLDYAAAVVGPEYRGVVGQIVDSLQTAVVRRLATVTQVRFFEFWGAPRAGATTLADDFVSPRSNPAPEAELIRFEDAHPTYRGASAADDVARSTWSLLRPSGGAALAAEAAVAGAAATALAARGLRPNAGARGARTPRIPRIRF